MRFRSLVWVAALVIAAGCADDAAPTSTSSVVPLPSVAPDDSSVALAPDDRPALAAFWSGFQTAVATGRDEAVLRHLHFPLVVAGDTVSRGGYASSLAAGLWGDEAIAAAIGDLTPDDLEAAGDGVRFTALTETVVDGETYESAVIGWIERTPEGDWKVTRLDLAG